MSPRIYEGRNLQSEGDIRRSSGKRVEEYGLHRSLTSSLPTRFCEAPFVIDSH
jgi:hypothetical protein